MGTTSRLHELLPGIYVASSRKYSLNTVVVTDPAHAHAPHPALVIDPGWDSDELESLADDLDELALIPAAGLATHPHFDHLLWHPRFGDVPRWASRETFRAARLNHTALLDELGPGYSDEVADLLGGVRPFRGGELIWDGPQVDLIVHFAHAPGHTAAWIADSSVLVAGDMLSDVELPMLDDGRGALDNYREGLDALGPFARSARFVIPGHGTPGTDAMARRSADLRYLDALEAGRVPDDPRMSMPDMAETHARNLQLV
jgi:glyoxylase-like metal-dependent hydrolase (beta-lactamase superfamily II)